MVTKTNNPNLPQEDGIILKERISDYYLAMMELINSFNNNDATY